MKTIRGLIFTITLISPEYLFAQPKWSPDGSQILFVQRDTTEVQVDGKYPASREIAIMNADGSNVRKLTSNNFTDDYPTMSPDGKTILFTTNRDGDWKLYTMNIDGSNQRDLGLESTSSVYNDPCRADWSPDGKLICFPWTKNGERILCIANADGTGVRAIPNAKGIYPHWSRSGRSITFHRKGNIHTINIDGTDLRQVTNNPDPASYETRPIYSQWSNDGKSIYYLKGDNIYKINVDGTGETQVTNTPGQKWYLGLSSRNKLIYITSDKGLDPIYTLDMDGKGLKRVHIN